MPTIQELRQQYPGYAEMRDEDIIADMAEANSVSAGTMARFLGWTPPSFRQEAVSGLKRGLGSMVAGGGQLMADAGWEDNPVLNYGKDVQSANPSRINSLEDVAAYPAAALGNATGTAVSFLGPQLGLRAVGKGLEAYGAARAAGLVGGMPGQTVMAGVPSYSEIRDSQIEAGKNNVPLALLGAGAVGAIENLGGVQRLMGIGRAAPKVLSKADEVASFGATPIRTGAKTLGRLMLEEGGEEIIQTPIEQLSGYKDPTTSQSLHETALGGVLGAMGGAIGLPVAVSSGLRHSQINQYRQSDLLSPDVPLNTLDDQAQWNREFMARDIGRDAADSWYASRMEGVVQDRDALIAERDRIARDAQFNELAAQRMGFNTYADYQAWEAEQEARTGTRRPTINERLGMLERQLPPGLVGMTTPITFTPSATENQPIVGALGNWRPNAAKPAQVAKEKVEAPKQEAGQKPAAASTTQGIETAAVVSQARPEFALEMQDSRFVGPEPVEVQEAVAATTPRGQKSLFDKNGKPTKTAIVAAPAKSQGAGTLAALQQKVDELFTPETEQHAAHTNAITTAKTYLQARLALAKLSPEGLRIALRTAPEKERAIINAVLGVDDEGNQVAQPRSYQDVGVQFGYPEKTARSNVQNMLKKYGIDREAVDKTVGSSEVGVAEKEKEEELDAPVTVKRPDENGVLQTVEVIPAKQKRKRIATAKGETTGGNQTANQLMQSQAVDSEGGTLEDAGFSVLDRASDSKVVEDARTAADTAKADRAIKEGVKEEKPELAARLEREAEEVAARSKSAESISKANREAAAAAARTQSVEDEESAKSLNWVDHRGLPIQKVDADEAALEYDAVARRLGKPEFGSLTEAEQLQVTRAYVSYMDDAIKAKDLKRVLNNVAEQTKQPSVERKAEKENDLSAVSGRGGEQSGEPSETLANPASESAVEPAGEASEVTPVQIAQAWHDYAQRWNLPKQHDLTADQQEELLSAYDQDSLQSAIRAIHYELNESSPQFSESTPKLGTNATEIAGNLKKLFFSPSRFDSLVTIVQSVNDLPETARQQLSQAADPSKVSGFAANGKVFLIADNIQAGKELSVFLHELGAHIGLKKLIGEANLKRLIAQIEAWAKKNDGSVESKLAKRAEERAAQSSSEDVQEEKLAYFIEEAVKAGINPTAVTRSQSGVLQNFFRTLIAALKTALRKIGLGRFDKLTAQNIVDLAYGAADLELNGTWHGTAADFRKFDHSYMGSGEGARRDAVKFSEATVYPTQDKIAELTDKLPVALRDKAYEIATNMVDIAKRSVYATAFGHDFARMVQGILPQAKTFFDLKGRQSAALINREAKVDEIMELAHKDKKSIPALNSFLEDSTRNQLWGFQPDWKQEPVAIDPEMERRFKQLSPSAQKAAVEVFRYGFQNVSELNKLVKEELNDYDTEGLTAEEKKDIEKKKLRALTLFDKTFKAMQGPYAPLVRVGDYVAVAKSQEFIDAQNRGDDKAVERMQADPDHYIVDYYESLGAAKNAARKLAATGKYAKGESAPDGYAKEHYYNKANETPWGALKKVRQMVDSEGDEARTKEEKAAARAMSNMLHDLYFQSLAEGSVRQFQSKRRNVASQKMDMLRGFAIKGRADAHFLSHLMFASQVGKAITDMRANAKGADARRALNEVLKRQAASLEYRQRPVLSFIQGVTSFWMLVTSPAYYVQNSTQPFMMTLPWLAGKYGYAKSWGAFFGAYNALIKGGLDIDKMPVSQAEKAMLHQLRDEGILDIGINRDLGYWANTDSAGLNHLASFQHMFTKKVQQLEMVNRISSALAAYRLSNGSVEVAAEAIRTTHGDYAQFNEPWFFSRVPAGRLILQFRKFQIIQLSMMTRLLADSMRGQNKAVAAKSLGFLLGHIGVMAGALGLPFMSLIAPVLAAAVGDGDDPDDLEYLLRKAIDDEAAANLILRGAPAGMGVNLSNRLGMQNMTSVFPFAEKDPLSKEGFQERALALLGPWAGLGANAADGIHLMMRGDYWKGAEKLIPKGPAGALKAMRFAVDGVTQRSNNDMLLRPEEISLLDASFQALGLPTTKLSERQRRQGELIKVEDHFKQLATDIKYKYTKAVKEGDSGEIAELQKEWASLQEAKVRNGFKRDGLSTLLKAPQEQAKRERNAIEGVEYKKNSRGFVQATAAQ